ncbi:MAG: AAA family ATPase [Streptosporangiales bacterium]|nr:AAA family ATPase [Streptosporangiales bacterium]
MSYLLLLGVADHALANSLRAQLSELPDIQIGGVERSSGDVVGALADEDAVDVVMVHEDLGPLPALELVRDIALRYPHIAVILLAGDPTPQTFTAAMEAGARGVLPAQPSLDELQTRIVTAGEWSRSMRRHFDASFAGPLPGRGGTLIALAGAKGGTGTTMLAVHLALAATAARRTVCLVDMDLQGGDLPSYLDVTHRRTVVDLVDVADDLNPTVLADTLFVHPAGPHVLLAPAEGERGEDVTARATRQILGSLRSRYDVVIADCGSHVSEGSAMAVEMADRVVMTVTPDLPALRAAKRLGKLWTRLQVRKEDDLVVVLTRHSRHNEIQPDFARKILGLPLLRTTVPAAFRALEGSVNTGTPLSVADEGFRRAIGQLAVEIGAVTPPGVAPAATAGGRRGRRVRGESGQASVETLSLAPWLLLILVFVWQVVLIGMGAVVAAHAANEGASRAAVGDPPAEVTEAALARIPAPWNDRASVHYGCGGGVCGDRVVVEIGVPVVLPGVVYAPWPIETEAKVVHEL